MATSFVEWEKDTYKVMERRRNASLAIYSYSINSNLIGQPLIFGVSISCGDRRTGQGAGVDSGQWTKVD
jgi:hypothetical protein